MKKKYAVGMAAVLACSVLFAACGGNSSGEAASASGTSQTSEAEEGVKGEVYDTTVFKALVPEGWKAFPGTDIWAEDEEDNTDPEVLYLYKGAESELDMFSKNGLSITYYGAETTILSARDFYDETEDYGPITTGDKKWEGYKATSVLGEDSEYHYTILQTGEEGEPRIYVVIFENMTDEETLTPEDPEVLAILESIELD